MFKKITTIKNKNPIYLNKKEIVLLKDYYVEGVVWVGGGDGTR